MNATAAAAVSPRMLTEDPEIYLAVEDLDLAGRGLAEAVWSGRHPAVLRGEGVEFHSHRSYQPGDDLRRVNWALYARQRRLYTRQSRQESRRPVYLLVDASPSMSIAHGPWSKLHYAARAAAGMAHLARRQGDAAGLGVMDGGGLSTAMPPRHGAGHVSGICAALSELKTGRPGDIAGALEQSRILCRQRGFIVLISDFLEQEDDTFRELTACAAQGHDVLALQVLDPVETELPKSGDYEFHEPETGRRLRVSTEEICAAYAGRVAAWRERLRQSAATSAIRWQSTTTAAPLTTVLREWLAGD